MESDASVCALNAWGTSVELLISHLRNSFPKRTIFALYPTVSDTERAVEDLPFFGCKRISHYISFDSPPTRTESTSLAVLGRRLEVLTAIEKASPLVVSSVAAAVQPVPDKETLASSYKHVREGDFLPPEDLVKWLSKAGFHRERMAERVGEFAVRGGIVDIFPLMSDSPVRLEFFGDDIESIRSYDPVTQRSSVELDEAFIRGLDSRKMRRDWTDPAAANIFSYLPDDAIIVAVEPQQLHEGARSYARRHARSFPGIMAPDAFMNGVLRRLRIEVERTSLSDSDLTAVDLEVRSLKRFEVDVDSAISSLVELAEMRNEVTVACHNEGEKERLDQLLKGADAPENVKTIVGRISGGFDSPGASFALIADSQVFNRHRLKRTRRRKFKGAPIGDLIEISPGDNVVHLTHGIAVYEGIHTLEKEGRRAEFMRLRFAGGVKIFVPLHNISLVQKYIGSGESPPLSTVGSVTWEKRKKAVEESLKELAEELLRHQAMRKSRSGIAHPTDNEWQAKFEASFPYEETEDQFKCIEDVKSDMTSPQPMDRLLCGDVGFGKTEVVVRAAFKAVMGGKQVAVVVPTTVLAEQHYRTFRERMAAYPTQVEVLSRFRSRSEQTDVVNRMKAGLVDVVIGTHRLFSKDVGFADLGLVVVDEEHKFGVEHKEALKKLKVNVDVLSLSATPIPRTMHMALSGIRDVSNLYTPPSDRMAIITRVARFDKNVVRRAIVRELDRNGQVFFLHNRVQSIHRIARMISRFIPEARIGIGHGQMHEKDLATVMRSFLDHKIDVLVCTTIIESGIDIPNANTILINEADQFGLATLHQLRGRIGRYKHQGYCYLLVPGNRTLSDTGRERLKAIEEFSDLGAGFQLAMRDLEIRGAGNLLGREQHGHINAIGYELYCKLLEKTVRTMTGKSVTDEPDAVIDLDTDAFFPQDFPVDENAKIRIYRKLARCYSEDDIAKLRAELEDVYGPLPPSVVNLLELQRLKLIAHELGIYRISLEKEGLFVRFRNFQLARAQEVLGESANLVKAVVEDGVVLIDTADNPLQRLRLVKGMLKKQGAA
ncbi:MAG: transcription-repair coupling factor [Planctomycetota bacterium]|nr:transcription-repair coupling factor [Planctomycetota bacterium]